MNYLNRADIRRKNQDVDAVPEGAFAVQTNRKLDVQMDLNKLLATMQAKLNPKQWQCIEKRFMEGKGHKECAEEIGLTPTQFRGVLNRAVEKLRNEFGATFWDYIKN